MRKIFILLLLVISFSGFGQSAQTNNSAGRQKFATKIRNYEKMRSTAITVQIMGVIGFGAGSIMAINADNKLKGGYDNTIRGTNDRHMQIFRYEGGIFIGTVGAVMLITGLVQVSVANRKIWENKQKLKMGFRYDNQFKGFCLAYKF